MAGFKNFLMRGNVIDLAIAFILGASFGEVVKAFTKIILDVIGLMGGNPNFDTLAIGPINVGVFVTALVSLAILATVLYFGVVKPYERIKARAATPLEVVTAPTTEDLLVEIRDLLKARPGSEA